MIKPLTVDEFGTQWYQATQPGFVTKLFPSQVFIEPFNEEPSYYQVACLETWCDWGLVTRDELTELGFQLRY